MKTSELNSTHKPDSRKCYNMVHRKREQVDVLGEVERSQVWN